LYSNKSAPRARFQYKYTSFKRLTIFAIVPANPLQFRD
jgi:hypothetical protein